MITTIDFLRHGEVSGDSYYRGSTDDPLTKKGWEQMDTAIITQSWEHIISSPLIRCADFAQQASKLNNTVLSISNNWQEIDFGDWEGKTAQQIDQNSLILFYQNPLKNTPPNAEPYSSFLCRINCAWDELIKTYRGKHILVITHAGVIRSLFNLHLNIPANKLFNIKVDHASLTRFECFTDSPENFTQLTFHNLVHPHLYSKK